MIIIGEVLVFHLNKVGPVDSPALESGFKVLVHLGTFAEQDLFIDPLNFREQTTELKLRTRFLVDGS
jgi:hypothetical protein